MVVVTKVKLAGQCETEQGAYLGLVEKNAKKTGLTSPVLS